MERVRVGLYGSNGHQVHRLNPPGDRVEIVAVACMEAPDLGHPALADRGIARYGSLAELIRDPRVEVVSLCSPRRADQARDAFECLAAGKHVYAEKPCAFVERDLDALIAAGSGKVQFREMAETAFEQPYLAIRELVLSGAIGTVVQVLVQKSYPCHDQRPQDEQVDGGLLMQVGVHALRMVEHVCGVRIRDIRAVETKLGNPRSGELRMASSMLMTLENGGVASAVANYLNPKAFGSWGNETLRIFGTAGFVEAVDGGKRTRLVLEGKDCGAVACDEPSMRHFHRFLGSVRGVEAMPLALEDDLHPTRMVIRAKESVAAWPR